MSRPSSGRKRKSGRGGHWTVPQALKRRAVELCIEGGKGRPGGVSYASVGRTVGLCPKVVANAHKNYLKYQDINAPKGPAKCYTDDDVEWVFRLLTERKDLYYEEVLTYMQIERKKQVSPSTLCNIYKELGFSRKRMGKVSTKRCVLEGELYFERIKGMSRRKMVFIDEVGTNAVTGQRTYGYGRGPVRIRGVLHKGVRYSTIAALSTSGIVASMSKPGSIKAEDYKRFVTEYLAPAAEPGGDNIIHDNCSTHSNPEVAGDVRVTSRNQKLIPLPPYSPHFNPIELCFRGLKAYLKKHRLKGYGVAVKDYFASVTPEIAASWFAQSYYHKPLDTGRMPAEAYEAYPVQHT
jgi:transposase